MRWRHALLVAGLILVTLAASCAPSATPAAPSAATSAQSGTASGAGGAAPAQPIPLTVIYDNRSVGTGRLWLMYEAGLFAKHGLDVQLESTQLGTRAMVAGQYDVGNVSTSTVIASDIEGGDLKIVMAINGKIQYALVVSKDITTPAQMRGKTFAIARIGDLSDTATRLILRRLGLNPDTDVTLLQVGNSPERYAALMTGQIQGMVADPMDVVRARRDGFSVIADPQTLNIDYAGNVMAMRGQFLRERRDVAMRVVRAAVEGIAYYKTHEDEAVAVVQKYLLSDDVDAIREGVRTFASDIMPRKPYVTESGLRPIIDVIAVNTPKVLDYPWDHFVDNSFVEELDRSGFIDGLYR
jgi:NitT/TauT family transport system substrate-binding protein